MFVHVWPMFYILLEENSMCLYMFGQGSACLGEAVHAWSCLIVFGCVWLCLVSSGQGCVPLTRSVVCLLD